MAEQDQIDADNDEQDVLPDGAEVLFADSRDVKVPDRVEFLDSGYVKAIYKSEYQVEFYPPHAIEGVYAHTNHIEDEDWW